MAKNKKFESEGYSLNITSKSVDITEAIENHILEKISKIERFTNHILDVVVTLDIQKVTNSVSILMKFLHFKINVQARTEDMYSAIDKAFEKLTKLIKKYKTKLQEHRSKEEASQVEVSVLRQLNPVDEINAQIEEENLEEEKRKYQFHEVVKTKSLLIKMLSQMEAAMKLELSGDSFLIYKGEEDQKLKIMYRRKDEKLGLIPIEK